MIKGKPRTKVEEESYLVPILIVFELNKSFFSGKWDILNAFLKLKALQLMP